MVRFDKKKNAQHSCNLKGNKVKKCFSYYGSKNLRGFFFIVFCPSPVAAKKKIFLAKKNIVLNLF